MTADLEDWQFVLGQGPTVTAFETMSAIEVAHRDEAPCAWAEWADRLAPTGLGSAFAFPLSFGEVCIGALTFYDSPGRALSAQERTDAAFCGRLAAATAAAAAAAEEQQVADLAARFSCATGILVARLQISVAEAERRIRRLSCDSGRPLRAVVDALITQDVDLSELARSASA